MIRRLLLGLIAVALFALWCWFCLFFVAACIALVLRPGFALAAAILVWAAPAVIYVYWRKTDKGWN